MNMRKLYCGDCLEILHEIPSDVVDVVFTSPPYNRKRNDKYEYYDDEIEDYYGFLCEVIDLCMEKAKRLVIFNIQANFYNKTDVYRIIGRYADQIQNIVIWEKTNPLPASGNNVTNAYEFFLMLSSEPVTSNDTYTKNHIRTGVNSQSTTKIHKAVMKEEVADWFIEKFVRDGECVLDPFMGLGTTGKSCIKYRHDFIGIEKNRTYFDYASKALEDHRVQVSIEDLL